jgi:hypothetical protein
MVTFETKVYENDWEHLLKGNYIDGMISRCNYNFSNKFLFINNVKDKGKVGSYAEKKVRSGILDAYYFVDDYAEEALAHFNISIDSFKKGYYYSIAELVSIFLCRTEYLLHFSSDSYLDDCKINWIDKAIDIFKRRDDIIVANPAWNFKFNEARKESFSEIDDFYLGFGFSDQCYLIRTDVFKKSIYNESHVDSDIRYPKYGGELFEKRVNSYMHNHELFRITSKEVSYIHKNFPKKPVPKLLYKIISENFNNGEFTMLFR